MKTLFLLLFSGLKFGKLATTGGTMLVSVVAYSFIWGWRYSLGFVVLLLVHELGHYGMARHKGLEVGAPTFIPFVGAWIQLKDAQIDPRTEADIAFAGPYLGTIGALLVYYAGVHLESRLLTAIAYSGLFLNLFNLLPVWPLDGGRITAILSPRIWLLGAPALLAAMFYWPSPALLIVIVLALPQVFKGWRFDPNDPGHAAQAAVPLETKIEYGLLYIGLCGFLAVMTFRVHELLSSSH